MSMVATIKPANHSPSFKDYETAEFDSARRRGRYYQQLSYKQSREGKNEEALNSQDQANRWFVIFEAMCSQAEDTLASRGPDMGGMI